MSIYDNVIFAIFMLHMVTNTRQIYRMIKKNKCIDSRTTNRVVADDDKIKN